MVVTLTAPPAPATRATLTPDDLLALEAEHDARYELVNGELQELGMPNPEHALIGGRISLRLGSHIEGTDRGVVLLDCSFTLQDDPVRIRIPDISFIATAHIPEGGFRTSSIHGAPDLAVEVVSPNDKARELIVKTTDYLKAGTQQVWIVEPNTRTVTVYKPGGEARVYGADDTLDGGDLLPGLALPVGDLFDYGVMATSHAE